MVQSRQSRFTYRHLRLLQQASPKSPLRVIALIDYDAFYAQCESVRLGLPPTVPLAVQQWNAIIALNYPARQYGLTRGMSVDEVKARCPDIVLQHVATWREGSSTWGYWPDVLQRMKTDKAALDPYRLEARRTMTLVRESLTTSPLPIERASIDEIFLDLSPLVYQELVAQHPELQVSPSPDLDAHLPLPQLKKGLEWHGAHLLGSRAGQPGDEESARDWDEIALNMGSRIVNQVRQDILRQLKYTSSAGIASNKMLAKLAAGRNKPNGQSVVLPEAVSSFFSSCPVKNIRGLGRDLGRHLVRAFQTDQVSALLSLSRSQLQSILGSEAGIWVYNVIRGVDESEVVSRTHTKSMLSAKTFVPRLPADRASHWLRIFLVDLLGRIHELEAEGYELRPTTLTLCHHMNGRFGPGLSRQVAISPAMPISETSLMTAADPLLTNFTKDPKLWPCQGLSLRLSGFQIKPLRKRTILSYFRRSDVAKQVESVEDDRHSQAGSYHCPHCNRSIGASGALEHLDWHLAVQLSQNG
ncbi:DNA/RNA polymerase [Aspergillus fijiensis CBS 313.89]|uniref:DNA/RNA polymerase n=1 Tax=Aspergillus fijiensis CBS 313.89 TaxID=1448319 RepID=A0A8G1RIZ1_9EURO|nr:DNA/RNA polymerase [Aspergillus fijiensis CBS 313.89]RAK71286.1 DNA/RNA polymerase [Aspergillus fijiensis CBS 313.89]